MRPMILSGAVTPSSLVLYLFGPLFNSLKNEIISSLPLIRLFLRWMLDGVLRPTCEYQSQSLCDGDS